MKIKIKYTAQLKKAIGKNEEIVELDKEMLVSEILNMLNHKHRQVFSNIVFNNNNEFMNAILLVLNGKQISYSYSEKIKENDVLTLMSPIAGG